MLFVALVFGEFASHYPVAGALYQYSKFSVGPAYGWFVGWFYGIALLVTVAAVDTGVVAYITALSHNWFGTNWDPTNHTTILIVTLVLLAIQTTLNITGAKVMGCVAQFGVVRRDPRDARHRDHPRDPRLPPRPRLPVLDTGRHARRRRTSTASASAGAGSRRALIAVLAPVYIFYGFESCGDIAEETKDAGTKIPKAMRWALIWGGIASFVLTAALLLAMPKHDPIKATVRRRRRPASSAQLSSGMQDFLLVLIIFAFFSCGTRSRARAAGSRSRSAATARFRARVGSRGCTRGSGRPSTRCSPARWSRCCSCCSSTTSRRRTSISGSSPTRRTSTPLFSLVSFGVSGIYLSFLLAVIAAIIARARGWVPEGAFKLGRWGWTVTIIAAAYLGLMLLNVVVPTGLSSGRALFNLDWITLLVMVVIAVVGAIYFLIARPDRKVGEHVHDDARADRSRAPRLTFR